MRVGLERGKKKMSFFTIQTQYFFGLSDKKVSLKYNKVTWYIFGLLARVQFLLFPALFLLSFTQDFPLEQEQIVSITIRVLQLVIGGWIVFNTFIRPNSSEIFVPEVDIRSSRNQNLNMFLTYNFGIFSHSLLFAIEGYLNQSESLFGFRGNLLYWILLGLIAFAFFVNQIFAMLSIRKKSISREDEAVQKNRNLYEGLRKLDENLQPKEYIELINLTYKTEKMSKASIQGVFNIIWLSILVAFLINVAEELYGTYLVNLIFP